MKYTLEEERTYESHRDNHFIDCMNGEYNGEFLGDLRDMFYQGASFEEVFTAITKSVGERRIKAAAIGDIILDLWDKFVDAKSEELAHKDMWKP